MSEQLLLEIGTEELPAAFLPGALSSFKALMEQELSAARISYESIETFGTPRRMCLTGSGIASAQQELVTQKTGPAKSIAYDESGNPTKAARGFARGQGIDVSELTVTVTEKGEYICAHKKEAGLATRELLPEMCLRVITGIGFPKSMRWHTYDLRFARPIHWIAALFGEQPVRFTLGGIESGNRTFGHRFMSPDPATVSGIDSYHAAMERGGVVVDPAQRRRIIEQETARLAQSAGGTPDKDESLLQEVTYLVESPFPVLCRFDDEFLSLPAEVLLTTMKKHQKYFPVLSVDGSPLPFFVAVNNTNPVNPRTVISGHERVLRARLADARFFYAEDRKRSLDAMAESLRQVVFQAKLGTSYEKMERFKELSLFIAGQLNMNELRGTLDRAAYLCKADLVSEMVGEFPELQGIMGREYARAGGEKEAVARAIFEHYLPRFSGDALPESEPGSIVSIADKLDTIAGCFGIGMVPTGTADPYALRRQCLGIIHILLDRRYGICLSALVEKAVSLLGDKISRPAQDICSDIVKFFSGRIENLLSGQGYPPDVIAAVLAPGIDSLPDAANRVAALHEMIQDPDFESLAVSFKRVVNILADQSEGSIDTARFQHDAERALYDKFSELKSRTEQHMNSREYLDALKTISAIRPAVDSFFDNVLVMDKDPEVRQNRLSLLQGIRSLFVHFADFSKLASR